MTERDELYAARKAREDAEAERVSGNAAFPFSQRTEDQWQNGLAAQRLVDAGGNLGPDPEATRASAQAASDTFRRSMEHEYSKPKKRPIISFERDERSVALQPAEPPAQTEEDRLKAYMAQFGSGGGGMYARLNSDQTGGYQEQRAGVQSMTGALAAEDETKRVARAGIQDLGAKYVTDLGLAQKKQQDLIDQRKSAIAEESRANKEAEGSFDSMRLTRKLGENPVSSAVMSFMAGLVGSLKGAAGDTSPNMILGEVDKAVERDVMNQKVQYERMRNGQDSARTNFTDEMKMGETEQTALLAATTASVGQHVKALEYAGARIGDAQAKAKVLIAAGDLRSEYGKLRYDADVKKAAAANASAAHNQALKLRFYEAEQAARNKNPEAMQKAFSEYSKIDKWKESLATTNALATVAKTLSSASQADLQAVYGSTFMNNLRTGLQNVKGGDVGVMQSSVRSLLTKHAYGDLTPKQQVIASNIQEFINIKNKERHGTALSISEKSVADLANGISTVPGLTSMVRREMQADLQYINGVTNIANYIPEMKPLFDGALGDYREAIGSYLSGTDVQAELTADTGSPQ